RKQCLDAAVPAVAHPAFQFRRARLFLDPGAVADALHVAADRHLLDRMVHFFNPRKSALRALASAARVKRAVSSKDARPFRFFGGVPSRNALSVSKTACVAAAKGVCPCRAIFTRWLIRKAGSSSSPCVLPSTSGSFVTDAIACTSSRVVRPVK